MAKVRTLSRTFMKGHPKAGARTFFECRAAKSLGVENLLGSASEILDLSLIQYYIPKGHTIRMGRHFKPVDQLTLAVWSDKPYRSKQIKLWTGEIRTIDIIIISLNGKIAFVKSGFDPTLDQIDLKKLSKNDGLDLVDFLAWFKLPKGIYDAQILIWNPEINY